MLPEILGVVKEDGDVSWVPLTPITTFRDVAACVRDTGDPLPFVIETSPLGVRVVAGWERPLELLRLWSGLKDQVSYTASYSHKDEPDDLLASFSRSYSLEDEEEDEEKDPISPWELYDLKDELKDLSSDLRQPLNTCDFDLSPLSRSLDDSDEFIAVSSDGEAESSYNSHTHSPTTSHFVRSSGGRVDGQRYYRNRSLRRTAGNWNPVSAQRNFGRSPFVRGRTQTSSLPSPAHRVRQTAAGQFHHGYSQNKPLPSRGIPYGAQMEYGGHNSPGYAITNAHYNAMYRYPHRSHFLDGYHNSDNTIIDGERWTRKLSPVISKKPKKAKSSQYKYSSTNSDNRLLLSEANRRHYPDRHRPLQGSQNGSHIQMYQNNGSQVPHVKYLQGFPAQNAYDNGYFVPQSRRQTSMKCDNDNNNPVLTKDNCRNSHVNNTNNQSSTSRNGSPRQNSLNPPNICTSTSYTPENQSLLHLPHRQEPKTKNDLDQRGINPSNTQERMMNGRYHLSGVGGSKNDQQIPRSSKSRSVGNRQQESASHKKSTKEQINGNGGDSMMSRDKLAVASQFYRASRSCENRQHSRDENQKYNDNGPRGHVDRPSRKTSNHRRGHHRRSYSDPLYEYLKEDTRVFELRQPVRRRRHSGGSALGGDVGMRDTHAPLTLLPDGCELTVGELRDMATRQQQQIETQQQLLVAREQRLKYLKQQESRAAAVAAETERLRRLRERVEAQEAKLRRLRALRGQVEATRLNTASLTTDLDAMRHLFSEKEKELVVAVAKVEELTRQLEELRHGRSPLNPNNQHHNELDKLRRELLYRNSVNREASARVAAQRETLAARHDEITRIDKRVSELQQRLHRKRILNHQLASQITAATQAKQAQLKAVQQKALRDGVQSENSADDTLAPDHFKSPPGEDLGEFGPNKNDPKYQTLPYNTKFSVTFKSNKNGQGDSDSAPPTPTSTAAPDATSEPLTTNTTLSGPNSTAPVNGAVVTRTVHSIPTHPPSRGHAHALALNQPQTSQSQASQHSQLQQSTGPVKPQPPPNPAMTPRVYGPGAQQFNQRSQPIGGSSLGQNQKLSPGVTAHAQSRTLLPLHHPQDVENLRALGNTTGGESNEESNLGNENSRNKPALPPKPAVPTKPLPPPRQKGDPLAASNESLNTLQVSSRGGNQGRTPHGYRYASQNVIMSTYTQQNSSNENQSAEDDSGRNKTISNAVNSTSVNNNAAKGESEGEKVHVSINRRIEMPPDFMFPEDETPPSDLLGRRVEEIENGNAEIQNNSNKESLSDAVDNMSVSTLTLPLTELEKLRIDHPKEEKSGSEEGVNSTISGGSIPKDDSRQPDGADAITVPIEEERLEGEGEKICNPDVSSANNNINNNNNNNNNNNSGSGVVVRRIKKGNLKTKNSSRVPRRVSFDPLALLLDASLEGELELVRRTAMEVPNPSAANDEGITALHNAICAGHLDIVTFLVTFGCDVNAQDSDGWTPLHCAASCNNVAMVRFLVEHGACILATTLSDHETAAEKCEQDEEGYDGCSQYLYSVQEKLGIMNGGVVYGVYDYDSQASDELSFRCSDALTILRRGDEYEREWWWGQLDDVQGYIPRNLLGLYPRVKSPLRDS